MYPAFKGTIMALENIDTIQGIAGKDIKVYDANYDNSKVDQEGFLKVLLTSFQFQDPFETQDISKFIDNTVKLRELEVMKNFEDAVKSLDSNNTLFLNTTNLIDKKVQYQGDWTLVEGGKSEVGFIPKRDANQATLYIYDENNDVVAQKEFQNLQAGQRYDFALEDEEIPDGYYKVSVVAKDKDKDVPVDTYATAKVTGIQKDGADIVALFDKGTIKIDDLEKIGG